MHSNILKIRRIVLSAILLMSLPLCAQSNDRIKLPELGDSSSGAISLQKEYELGRAFLKALRSQVRTVSDPIIQDYLEELIYKLARFSELKDRRLDIVVLNNMSINAFAVPGGVIGVHNGLILEADTESQLASVLTHELAHLSQRHFARRIEKQRSNTIPNVAGLIAGIIVAATVGGSEGMAAVTAVQAVGIQNQLRYSRQNEQEADRMGMQTMIKANMDPNGAQGMFEKMQRASLFAGNRPPEFLLTHPVTESRISDARNRSRLQPRKIVLDSTHFRLVKTRVAMSFSGNRTDTVAQYRSKIDSGVAVTDADQYGLVLALTEKENFIDAENELAILRKNAPHNIIYIVAQAQIYINSGRSEEAVQLLDNALLVNPKNHPLTMTLASVLLKANRPHNAESVLQQHTEVRPNDPSIWYLLAEAHGLAGNILGVHKARAEYFVLNGILRKAVKQLGYALKLVEQDHYNTIKIEERIKQIRQMEIAMDQL